MDESEKKLDKKEHKPAEEKKEEKNKSKFMKVWDFLWNSNSIWAWILDLVIIFLVVKFIIFPVFGLALGTSLPFVIIESGSMEHQGSFDQWFAVHGQWYIDNNISRDTLTSWKWQDGLDKGDIIIVQGLKDFNYERGDVIIFKTSYQNTPIIHRVIDKQNNNGSTVFVTKGDHNDGQLPYEYDVREEQIVGRAVGRIPKLGWIKLFFVNLFR